MSQTNNQGSISTLIASRVETNKAEAEKKDETRFMLVIPTKERDKLRDLCEKLDATQIKFASELFVVALNDAVKAFNAAQPAPKA